MATRFEKIYNYVSEEVKQIKDKNNYGNDSKAFGHYMLKAILNIDDIEAYEAITDGYDDYGIDAIYFDKSDISKIKTYFFQFKFPASVESITGSVKQDELLKLIDGYEYFVGNDKKFEERKWNDLLLAKRGEFVDYNSFDHILYIIEFKTNEKAKKNIELFESKIRKLESSTGNKIKAEYCFAKDISDIYDNIKQVQWPSFELTFNQSSEAFTDSLAKISSFYVSLAEIYKGLKDIRKRNLYEGNVRYYYRNSKVNSEILKTLGNLESCKKFHLLNNGITIVCSHAQKNSAKNTVKVDEGSIINGAQTVECILQKLKEEEDNNISIEQYNNSFVFLKIIELSNKHDLVRELVLSLNTQNPMNRSYSISNQAEIKQLQEDINKNTDYFLQIKSNEFQFLKNSDTEISKKGGKIIDIEQGLQTFVAYENINNLAHLCKTNKAQLFDEFSEKIIEKLDAKKLVKSYELFLEIMSITRDYRSYRRDNSKKTILKTLCITETEIDDYRFLTTGNYLILFSLGIYCRKKGKEPEQADIIQVIKELKHLFSKDEQNISNLTRKKETYDNAKLNMERL